MLRVLFLLAKFFIAFLGGATMGEDGECASLSQAIAMLIFCRALLHSYLSLKLALSGGVT